MTKKSKKNVGKCLKGYEITVDYGKPYTECASDKRVLKRKMKELNKFYNKSIDKGEDFPYFDVSVSKVKKKSKNGKR